MPAEYLLICSGLGNGSGHAVVKARFDVFGFGCDGIGVVRRSGAAEAVHRRVWKLGQAHGKQMQV